jgi:hypothetical protein
MTSVTCSLRHCAALLNLMVAACGSGESAPEGPALQQALIGTWGTSMDGGKTFIGYEQYRQDGSFRSRGTLPDGRTIQNSGRFSVDGRRLCETIEESSIPSLMAKGEVPCGDVLAIDSARRKMRSVTYGDVFIEYKVPAPPDFAKE